MKARFNKLTRETLHDRLYNELKAAIMAGRFASGERLTVRGIAEAFGVSPMPVRAAFTRLVSERVVAQNASGNVELPEMTRKDYLERFELRALLEGRAAEMAARNPSKRTVARLRMLGNALTQASLVGDARGYVDANKKFKFAIVEAAGSEPLTDLVERLWLQVGPFMHLYQTDVRHQVKIDRHEQIVDAIEKGDGPAARREVERDIRDGMDFLLEKTGSSDSK